jgi:hypothetical protein
MEDNLMFKPDCYKMDCTHSADVVLRLPTFGPIYFCAAHGLPNLRIAPEGILEEVLS